MWMYVDDPGKSVSPRYVWCWIRFWEMHIVFFISDTSVGSGLGAVYTDIQKPQTDIRNPLVGEAILTLSTCLCELMFVSICWFFVSFCVCFFNNVLAALLQYLFLFPGLFVCLFGLCALNCSLFSNPLLNWCNCYWPTFRCSFPSPCPCFMLSPS